MFRFGGKNANPWMYAGLSAALPNLEPSPTADGEGLEAVMYQPTSAAQADAHCGDNTLPAPPCKLFQKSEDESSLSEMNLQEGDLSAILVFRYRGKIHAMDHTCPHQSHPMSQATLHDIEDFGVILSAGITCPKHGWSFDLHTGQADTGRYKLTLYEVETRDGKDGEEVWLRKKEKKRIG